MLAAAKFQDVEFKNSSIVIMEAAGSAPMFFLASMGTLRKLIGSIPDFRSGNLKFSRLLDFKLEIKQLGPGTDFRAEMHAGAAQRSRWCSGIIEGDPMFGSGSSVRPARIVF